MNRIVLVVLGFTGVLFTGCKATREILKPEEPALAGLEGLVRFCEHADTVRSILIGKAESLIEVDDERYEAELTVYIVRDSLIYLSAVNSGFEILRAVMDHDTIKVIDRINKIVYRTPVRRELGYSHPVDYNDVQSLFSNYFLCADLERGFEPGFDEVIFDLGEPFIKKQIIIGRKTLKLIKFEFYHSRTNKYVLGERTDRGIRILTNFIFSDLEVTAWGGTLSYNREVPVKMDVNRKRYTFVNL
jgi:hypothetical protein